MVARIGISLFSLVAATGCATIDPSDERRSPHRDATAVVASVTDGDTIRLETGQRVRLVQVDAPETEAGPECGGEAARSALRARLAPGTDVRLEVDTALDAEDRFGRLLRTVLVDDVNLNVTMVELGHAAPYFYRGERGAHADELLAAARTARAERRGLWGACPRARLDPTRALDTGPGR